jgi:hypothetical protein
MYLKVDFESLTTTLQGDGCTLTYPQHTSFPSRRQVQPHPAKEIYAPSCRRQVSRVVGKIKWSLSVWTWLREAQINPWSRISAKQISVILPVQ